MEVEGTHSLTLRNLAEEMGQLYKKTVLGWGNTWGQESSKESPGQSGRAS